VRCYGAHLNAFAALEIRRELGVPFVVSLHINPDEDIRGRLTGFGDRLRAKALSRLERRTLREADLVLPVYQSIVPYLERIGVQRYEVAYNLLPASSLRRKRDYALHEPVEIVSVGRQIPEKLPLRLIEAVAGLPSTRLTLIGDGPEHERLRRAAVESGAAERIAFERVVPNDVLCRRLPEFDVFATHSEYWELSKAVLEAFLSGLPVVLNRRRGEPVPELTDDICVLVEDSAAGYGRALQQLIADPDLRRSLGEAAAERADRLWSPTQTEARLVGVYRRLLIQNQGPARG
jgi:glycosyltransferase involved in cell wall biosynthesis